MSQSMTLICRSDLSLPCYGCYCLVTVGRNTQKPYAVRLGDTLLRMLRIFWTHTYILSVYFFKTKNKASAYARVREKIHRNIRNIRNKYSESLINQRSCLLRISK